MSRKKVKKRRRLKKRFKYIGIPFLIILIAAGGYVYNLYSTTQSVVDSSFEEIGRDQETSNLREEKVDPVEDNVSVLIIGVDDSEERGYNGKSRSDALILATFNKESEDIKLLSIPRDTYVYVPEVGYNTKINHAHFFGGPKATIETIEGFLDIPIDYYVRFNFDAFIEVVDSLDGIYYDVPYEITELNSNDKLNAIHLEPGYQLLDGEEALALARTRKYDSDIQRGERQQEIIKAIVDRATSTSSLLKFDDVIRAIGNNMTTNITFNEMKSFVSYGLNTNINIQSVRLEGTGDYLSDGLWYYVVDETSKANISNELREHLDLPVSFQQENETRLSVDDEIIHPDAY